jgi:hypothetical protein
MHTWSSDWKRVVIIIIVIINNNNLLWSQVKRRSACWRGFNRKPELLRRTTPLGTLMMTPSIHPSGPQSLSSGPALPLCLSLSLSLSLSVSVSLSLSPLSDWHGMYGVYGVFRLLYHTHTHIHTHTHTHTHKHKCKRIQPGA